MSIINFTVTYDQFASQTDFTDVGNDADIVALIGTVTFIPQLADDKPILAQDYSPRSAGFKLRPFTGYLDSDGRLKATKGGAVGVRLWANDPVLELEHLYYKVDFGLTTTIGEPVAIEGGYFEAPSTDTTVNLTNVLTSTASTIISVGRQQSYSEDIMDSGQTGRELIQAADTGEAWTTLGMVPTQNLPSYVDDVLEYATQAAFPATGETGKIYVDKSNNDSFRWTGSVYIRISDRVTASGITDSTTVGRALITAADAAAARTTLSTLGVNVYDTDVLGVRTKTSTTYGTGHVFGTASSFGFAGTGTPAEIAGAFGIYQEYGKANPRTNILKTTQGGYCITNYWGPTTDDVMESFSVAVLAKDSGTAWTQTLSMTGFEAQTYAESNVTTLGKKTAVVASSFAKGTASIADDIGFLAQPLYDNTATVTQYIAFNQRTAGTATYNFGVWTVDQIRSDTGISVEDASSTGYLRVKMAGNTVPTGISPFMWVRPSYNTDLVPVRVQGSSSGTKPLTEWWAPGATSVSARIAVNGSVQTSTNLDVVNSDFSAVYVRTNSSGIQLGSGTVIELGHASDTTLSRSSAGVLAVEGVAVPTISSTDELFNKTISGSSNTLTNIGQSSVTNLTTDLAGKVPTTRTINSKALSANVSLTQDDIPDGTTNKVFTASDKTRLENTSGTNTGDQTSVSGNAGTATKLETARTISGVSFDGSANIDVVTAKTVGPAFYQGGYVSGQYYYTAGITAPLTSATLGNGSLRVLPWIVTDSITVSRLFAEFSVAGDANSVFRIGVWNHDPTTGKPGTLVLDAGTISTGTGNAGDVATGGTAGIYERTVSLSLTPGVYWVGGAVQGVTTTQPTMRTAAAYTIPLYLPVGSSLPAAGSGYGGAALGGQTGAFGSMAGSSPSSMAPARIGFKVS